MLSGNVAIEDDRIDLQPPEPTKTLGYGMMVQFDASNRGAAGEGRIRITGNRVVTNEGGIPFPGAQTPNAVLVGYFADRTAATDSLRVAEHVVEKVADEGQRNRCP